MGQLLFLNSICKKGFLYCSNKPLNSGQFNICVSRTVIRKIAVKLIKVIDPFYYAATSNFEA